MKQSNLERLERTAAVDKEHGLDHSSVRRALPYLLAIVKSAKKHAFHNVHCSYYHSNTDDCNCGLQQLIDAQEAFERAEI